MSSGIEKQHTITFFLLLSVKKNNSGTKKGLGWTIWNLLSLLIEILILLARSSRGRDIDTSCP